MRMGRLMVLLSVLSLALSVTPLTSEADSGTGRGIIVTRDAAEPFIVLDAGVRRPEGLTANPDNGDLFVATFDAAPDAKNRLLRFDRRGHLEATIEFGAAPLLGLEFNRKDHKVYICNFDMAKIQRVPADFTSSSTTTQVEDVADLPKIGAPPALGVPNPDGSKDTITFDSKASAPNAMTFSANGDLFVSDSWQGAIFKIRNAASCATPCTVDTVKHDGRLATVGFPPFGANGLALNKPETKLFVANTGDDRVLVLDLTVKDKDADNLSVFAETINGADGLLMDHWGRLWVCANQADEIVGLSATGRVIAKLGNFFGINEDRTPRGLLFPASNVIVGDDMFVTNLAIHLRSGADEPEADVKRWTISRLRVPRPDEN
jgi:sugar lactone lactonase YvrE